MAFSQENDGRIVIHGRIISSPTGINFGKTTKPVGADSISALLGPSRTPVPTRFVVNFDVLSVGEALRLPFLHKFVGRGDPSPTGIKFRRTLKSVGAIHESPAGG